MSLVETTLAAEIEKLSGELATVRADAVRLNAQLERLKELLRLITADKLTKPDLDDLYKMVRRSLGAR